MTHPDILHAEATGYPRPISGRDLPIRGDSPRAFIENFIAEHGFLPSRSEVHDCSMATYAYIDKLLTEYRQKMEPVELNY